MQKFISTVQLAEISEDEFKTEVTRWKYKWSGMDPNVTPQTLVETLDHANSQFYPGVYVALVTLLTYPVSTCTAERSFSSMKRLKSRLRSTMTDERLSSLAILHIHKHKNVDIDRLVTEFARLIVFVFFFFFSEHCSLQKTLGKWLK